MSLSTKPIMHILDNSIVLQNSQSAYEDKLQAKTRPSQDSMFALS